MEAIGILGDIREDISNNSNHELNERLQQLLQRIETTLENLHRIRLSQGERKGASVRPVVANMVIVVAIMRVAILQSKYMLHK